MQWSSNQWMRERRMWHGPRLSPCIRSQDGRAPGPLSRHTAWARSLKNRLAQRKNLRLVPALQTLLHASQGKWISSRWFRPVVQLAFHQHWNGAANPGAVTSAPGLQVPMMQVVMNSSTRPNFHSRTSQSVLNRNTHLLERMFASLAPMQAAHEGSCGTAAQVFDVVRPMRLLERHSSAELRLRTDATRMVQRLEKISQRVLQQTRRVAERRVMPEMRMQRMSAPPREIASYGRQPANDFSAADVRHAAGATWTGGAMPGAPNIMQITDEVVRQLDRRFVASRERLGKI